VSKAIRPCGHLCCCEACAEEVITHCPICMEPVEGLVDVVIPKPKPDALPLDLNLFLQKHDYFGVF